MLKFSLTWIVSFAPALALGIRLERPESLNASLPLAKAIADLAQQGFTRLDA